MKYCLTILIYVITFSKISASENNKDSSVNLKKVIHKLKIRKFDLNVIYFLEPTCPISQKYQSIISNLNIEFDKENINTTFIFPNTFTTKNESIKFANEIDKKAVKIFDTQKKITKIMGATITPEVFLVNKKGQIIYNGAIDDWFYALGKKRTQASTYFLKNAISNYKNGLKISPSKTEAIGCDIEL